jgi:hypothetical protein
LHGATASQIRGAAILQKIRGPCENSGAKLTNAIFGEFWPVLSDQKPADAKIRSERTRFQPKREFSNGLFQSSRFRHDGNDYRFGS